MTLFRDRVIGQRFGHEWACAKRRRAKSPAHPGQPVVSLNALMAEWLVPLPP